MAFSNPCKKVYILPILTCSFQKCTSCSALNVAAKGHCHQCGMIFEKKRRRVTKNIPKNVHNQIQLLEKRVFFSSILSIVLYFMVQMQKWYIIMVSFVYFCFFFHLQANILNTQHGLHVMVLYAKINPSERLTLSSFATDGVASTLNDGYSGRLIRKMYSESIKGIHDWHLFHLLFLLLFTLTHWRQILAAYKNIFLSLSFRNMDKTTPCWR